MKVVAVSLVSVCFIAFVSSAWDHGAPAAKDDISFCCGDYEYFFGSDGEGLKVVKKSNSEVYDFGTRPCWFMLGYLHQESDGMSSCSESEYYYPQLGGDSNFVPPAVHTYIPPFHYVLYNYEFNEPVLQSPPNGKTKVALTFAINEDPPCDGVSIFIKVDNEAPDNRPTQLRRLMEVHCPFVRLPRIPGGEGEGGENDRLLMGNYLIEDPMENYKLEIEPWLEDEGGNNYIFADSYYPAGFPVWAFYDEPDGRGIIYLAVYNVDRKVCQTNFYKHIGDYEDWPYIGDADNQPNVGGVYGSDRRYLVWDVVRYTENVDEPENDYPSDTRLCAFMKFYDQGLDWYKAAKKYRNTVQQIDNNTPYAVGNDDYLFFKDRDGSISLWPEMTAEENPAIPDWAKYHALMLYVSPQANVQSHDFYPGDSDERYVLRRIRDYQARLAGLLDVYDCEGCNDLLVSSWINEWAEVDWEDEGDKIDFLWNHPEWSGSSVPTDSEPPLHYRTPTDED